MSFLNLWALWIAAAVIPALLVLYFLKLRRREELVASTLLWKRAVQDLQVNAPFQKLRKNLLLLLQLLVLSAGIVALARPILSAQEVNDDRVVLIIDRSASMNTIEADGRTRLDHAKEQAVRRVRTYNRRGSRWFSFAGAQQQTRIMVITFAERATVISPFTTNMAEVIDLINRIEPSDALTDMREAMELAEAYMSPPSMLTQGMEDTPVSAESSARVVLFSDGCVPDSRSLVLKTDKIDWAPIGEATDNAGITALRARRGYESPEIVQAFLEVQNFSPEPVSTDVSIYVDGELVDVKPVSLGGRAPRSAPDAPATQPAAGDGAAPIATLSFQRPVLTAATIEARIVRSDALAADNSAFSILPPPRKLRVMVVTRGNRFLEFALRGLPLEKRNFVTPEQYESLPHEQLERDGHLLYDLVVFDKQASQRLPLGNYWFIGCAPQVEGIQPGEELAAHALIWWDVTHPVLRYVELDYVYVARALTLVIPPAAEKIIEGPRGASLARFTRDGRNYLVLTFAFEDTNWIRKRTFPAFIQNAVQYMGSGAAESGEGPIRPGAALRIPAPPGAEAVRVRKPDGSVETAAADASGVARFSSTHKVGVYRVENGAPERDRYAVNLESADESNITPPPKLMLGAGTEVAKGELIRASTPEVWRWFVGAALVVLMIEWYIYNRRVMI